MRSLTVITPPTDPVITLAEAKLHLRVDGTDEDSYITMLVGAATRYIERTYGLAVMEQSIQETFDYWEDVSAPRSGNSGGYGDRPGGYGYISTGVPFGYGSAGIPGVFLDRSGPSGVESIGDFTIQTVARPGAALEVSSTDYQADLKSRPARIAGPSSGTLPLPYAGTLGGISVTYVAGEPDAGDVPEDIKVAILMLVADLYENRSNEVTGTIVNKLSNGLEMLLANWKLRSRT